VNADDETARFAYLAEGNARQARKRVAADVLIRDNAGLILLVEPTYKDFWDLPGGMAEANEPPRAAAERELREELGLDIRVGRLLVLDWDGPHGPWDDQLVFVFDGDVLTDRQATTLHILDPELASFAFLPLDDAVGRLTPHMGERLRRADKARKSGETDYAERRRTGRGDGVGQL
jgi:8-oxo-dGTP pyrophosphatase MutT (NUDIX family)